MEENNVNAKNKEIHLALVISGAVSLGSYEAGALVKLIRAVKDSQKPDYKGPKLVIDVIAGASAGAMTGAMVAYCLLTGVKEEIIYQAWVEDIDLKNLENKFGTESILSSRQIEELANKYFKNPQHLPPEYFDKDSVQKYPIRLVISLTNLNGRNFSIPIHLPTGKEEFSTFTYRDGRYYDLSPDAKWEEKTWKSIKEVAIASGAFPVAFEPVKMQNKIETNLDILSPDESFYTDGGVLNNKPLGLAIDASFNPESFGSPENMEKPIDLSGTYERYFILIQPEAGRISPSINKKAFVPVEIAINSFFTIPLHQSLYDDLKKIERINQHIEWNEEFLSALSEKIKNLSEDDSRELEKLLQQKSREILEFKSRIAPEEKRKIYALENQKELKGKEPELVKYLRLYINLIGRLRGKGKIYVFVIRPTTEIGKEKDILAGEFLSHFGGFLSRKLRNHDFIVGYRNAQEWLGNMEWNNLVGSDIIIRSLKRKKAQTLHYDARLGKMSFKHLPYWTRLRAYFTGIKAVEVLFYSFAQKHSKFNSFLNLVVGFLKLLAYPLAMMGGGLWVILAFVIFGIGLCHSFGYIQQMFEFIKGFF